MTKKKEHASNRTTAPVDAIPEERMARVAALRDAILNGTYQIPSDQIADKLIEDMLRKP